MDRFFGVQPGSRVERYRVTADFTLEAEDIWEAEEKVKDLIQEGILTLIERDDIELIDDYDIVNTEIAEIL